MTTKGQKASVVHSYCQQHFVSVPHISFTHKFWCFLVCAGVSSHVDDEYKWAGVEDPKVMVTTSRDPSSRLKMFAKVRSLSEHKHVEASKTSVTELTQNIYYSTYLMACAVISTLVLHGFQKCFCIL